jgi:PAS domain S-box-containing protein
MMVDKEGTLLFINRSVTGRPVDEAMGKTVYDYTPPKYHDMQRAAIKRVFESGEQSSYDVEGPGPDGATIWFRTRIGPVTQEGEVVAAILTTRDVTARKLMEKALQTSESNYRTLVEHTLHGIGILQGQQGNSRLVFANPALTRITGYSAEEITSFSFMELASIIVEEDRLKFGKAFWDHVHGRTGPPRCEVRVIHKDKSIIWTDVTGTPFKYEGQTSWLVTFVNITERKQAEAQLQAREQQLQVLADNIPGIVYRLHLQGEERRELLNDRLQEITGYTEEELPRGTCLLEPIIHSKDRAQVKAQIKQALENGTSFNVQYRITHKDGRTRVLQERGHAVKDDNSEPLHLDGVILAQPTSLE